MIFSKGFTLIELLVSISIFVFMTVLLVAKYGTFNQSVLLSDTAYDIATTIRTAQAYGISVTANNNLTQEAAFQSGYGVDFYMGSAPAANGNTNRQLVLFADTNPDKILDVTGDTPITTYAIKRGAIITSVCAGTSSVNGCVVPAGKQLDISFKRPYPDAAICADGSCNNSYAAITVTGTDGSTRIVTVRGNGQISVGQ